MNLLFTSFNQEGKGSFLRAFAFAKELVKRGHQLTVLCASTDSRFEEKHVDGVRLVCFPWGKRFLHGYNPCEVRVRKRWLSKQVFDVVHAFDMRPTCAQPAFQAKRHGALMVTDWADWFGKGGSVEERANPLTRALLRPIETYGERSLRKKADATTCICSHLYQMGLDLNIPAGQLAVIYNGFDQKISPRVSQNEARHALNLEKSQKIVGSLGAFFSKDFELLQLAAKLTQAEMPVQFLHIGQGQKQSNTETIDFTGRVSDEALSLYLQACDILLLPMADLPANHGRFPLKFSEYISAGRPVLATDVGDVPSFILKHDCGKVCQPNAQVFAQTIIQMLSDPESLNKQSQNASRLSEDPTHSWQARSVQLESFYTQLLSNLTKHD